MWTAITVSKFEGTLYAPLHSIEVVNSSLKELAYRTKSSGKKFSAFQKFFVE